MRFEVISARELDPGLCAAWRDIQAATPRLASPYFSVQYTKLTAEVRDDVFVGIAREGSKVQAFLPFQRALRRVGRPVSGPMSDYQGLICRDDTYVDPKRLLRGCRLDMLEFDHQIASQEVFRPFHRVVESSPIIDVSRGFDAYVEERRKAGSKNIKKIRRMARVLERDVGPVRFERHVLDPQVFEQLVAWKRYQCQSTGSVDLFSFGWAHELLRRIHATQDQDFAGVLSAVWAGDTLAAAHMGMRSDKVWHYWFPSYNRELHSFSPGLVLLLWMAEQAPEMGLEYIDLGKGESQYKDRVRNGEILIAEGRVTRPSVLALATEASERGAAFVRKTPLATPARYGVRALRRVRRWADER